jgi:hypothetical protein
MAALDDFISSFNKFGGPALLNRFAIKFFAPGQAVPSARDDSHMWMRAESVTMPGRNIRTVTNENIYGPTHEMAQGLTYAETIDVTFYLSADHFERNYFRRWMEYIYKPNTNDLEYYKNYIEPMEIYQLDKDQNPTAGVKLNEVFPKTLGPVEFSNNSSELGRQQVSFAFKDITFIDGNGNDTTLEDNREFRRNAQYRSWSNELLNRTFPADGPF